MDRIATLAAGLLVLVPSLGRASADIVLDASLDTPVLPAGESHRAYLRVALTGPELGGAADRPPVNLALVLDRSGSMSGDKIARARRAAHMAIDRLAPDDIVSIVTYDSVVNVLVPATKVRDRDAIFDAIDRIEPGGSTALFAGVSKGAAEIRKFLTAERVNRVILLSDGLANVGPSTPGELAELGASLAKEGIAVSTVGLGLDYNEELMSRLAAESDGNHFFAANAADLERIYLTELGEVLSVVAQDVDVTVEILPPCRPVRVLGREADVHGQRVIGRLNQLYARQTKYFIIEVEIPGKPAGQGLSVADVQVSLAGAGKLRPRGQMSSAVACVFSASAPEVERARNARVIQSVVRQIGAERTREAMLLRDQGKIDESRTLLSENAAYLRKNAELYDNRYLASDADRADIDAKNLDEKNWRKQRKQIEADELERLHALGYVQ
ncbi:MAG: VWA domain-containing protein [Acidobacteriota bacterium]